MSESAYSPTSNQFGDPTHDALDSPSSERCIVSQSPGHLQVDEDTMSSRIDLKQFGGENAATAMSSNGSATRATGSPLGAQPLVISHGHRMPVLTCAEDVIRWQSVLGLTDNEVEVLGMELELQSLPDEEYRNALSPSNMIKLNSYEAMISALSFEKVHRDFVSPLKLDNGAITFYDVTIDDLFFLQKIGQKLEQDPDAVPTYHSLDEMDNTSVLTDDIGGTKSAQVVQSASGSNSMIANSVERRQQRPTSNEGSSVLSGFQSENGGGSVRTANKAMRANVHTRNMSYQWELWRVSKQAFPRDSAGRIQWPPLIREFTLIVDALERIMQDSAQNASSHLSLKQVQRIAGSILGFEQSFINQVVPSIYDHWRRARNNTPSRCLVREFLSPHNSTHEQGSFSAFKPRNRERWAFNVRRQRRPNRENHKKLFRLARDFVDVVGLMSLIVHIDSGNRTARRLKKLHFLERRREIMDANYESPFQQRKLTLAVSSSATCNDGLTDSTVDNVTTRDHKKGLITKLKTPDIPVLDRIARKGFSFTLERPQKALMNMFRMPKLNERVPIPSSIGLSADEVGIENPDQNWDTLPAVQQSNTRIRHDLMLETNSSLLKHIFQPKHESQKH